MLLTRIKQFVQVLRAISLKKINGIKWEDNVKHLTLTINLHPMHTCKGVFKGGSGGANPPPPRNFQIFGGKSEGKEVERKRKKRDGGWLIVNIFYEWGSDIFREG